MNLRDLPIARKLALLVAGNTLVALLLITLVFTAGAALKAYRDTQEQLTTLATVIGENSRAALAFRDVAGALATLSALRNQPGIVAARLFDPAGVQFARYAPLRQPDASALTHLIGAVFPVQLSIAHDIVEDGSAVGRIEIDADIAPVWLGLLQGLGLVALLALALTLLAIYYGLRLSTLVTAPIEALAAVTRRVLYKRDYSARAHKAGNDEVGALVDDFNLMLDEIQMRDDALCAQQQTLELRVEERTSQLLFAKDEAERANAAKSDFLSRMSHELRTPLNAIIGFAQLLESDDVHQLSPQQADNVHEILRAGHHLLAQVNEVLDLARIESGRIELELAAVPLTPMVAACIAQLQPLARQRLIATSMEIAPELAVKADPIRLRQVLINLLSNAIKYNHQGGHVAVRAEPVAAGLRVTVRDTGRGIAPQLLDRLFLPFERLESSYAGTEGTGIGLALVKKLVEAMDGRVGVDSMPEVGSEFWFELPATTALPPANPPAAKVGADETVAPPSVATARRSVLYIEDNLPNLKLVRKLLELRPHLALHDAANAEQGIELARALLPDLILLDINLPGMDGFAALRELRADPRTKHIPAIAVTANVMARDMDRCLAAGFDGYIAKPFDVGTFLQAIDRNLASAKETPS